MTGRWPGLLPLLWRRLPDCPPGPFADTVRQLCRQQAVPVRVVCRRRRRGGAMAYPGRTYWIVAMATVLTAPAEVQRLVAAHEVGHLVLRHRPLHQRSSAFVWVGLAVAVFAVAQLIFDHVRLPPPAWLVSSVIVGGLVPLALFWAGMSVYAGVLRTWEREADEFAAAHGYPISPPVATWFDENEPKISRLRIFRTIRSHPLPAERISR